MNEKTWLASFRVNAMLNFLDRDGLRPSQRLRRLVACAMGRLSAVTARLSNWGEILDGEQGRAVVGAIRQAERYCLAGRRSRQLTQSLCQARLRIQQDMAAFWGMSSEARATARPSMRCVLFHACRATAESVQLAYLHYRHGHEEANVLRDILGNPFQASACPADALDMLPPGLSSVTVSMARLALDEAVAGNGILCPVRLAVLADALEESGHVNAALIDHLRQDETHYAGCWAVGRLARLDA